MIWFAIALLFLFCIYLSLCCGYLYNQVTIAGRILFQVLQAHNELKKRLDNMESPSTGVSADPELQ